MNLNLFFIKMFMYVYVEREMAREREGERETKRERQRDFYRRRDVVEGRGRRMEGAGEGRGRRMEGAGWQARLHGRGSAELDIRQERLDVAHQLARPHHPPHLPPMVQGSGCRVQGAGFRVQGSGFRVQGAGCMVQSSGCRVQGAWFRVQGAGCRVQGAGFRVQGAWCRVHGARHLPPRDRKGLAGARHCERPVPHARHVGEVGVPARRQLTSPLLWGMWLRLQGLATLTVNHQP